MCPGESPLPPRGPDRSAPVVWGGVAGAGALLAGLQERGVSCRSIQVDVAAHSPHIDGLRADLLAALAGLKPQLGTIPIFSTVTGAVCDGADFDADYWVRNLGQPVLFAPAIEQAADAGHGVFVEISPHPVLGGAVGQVCGSRWPGTAVLASTRRDSGEREVMLESLAELYRLRVPVAWEALYPADGRGVRLPRYQWQHERFWAGYADRW